ALLGMVPIVFGAGLLLGTLARAAGTLWFGILGHWLMDIGLFLFWWTQVAGTFHELPIWQNGIDRAFFWECGAFAATLAILFSAMLMLLKLRDAESRTSGSNRRRQT